MRQQPNYGIIVTIHDQDLVLKYEVAGKFNNLKVPVTYVFVGMGAVDKLESLTNVIVARDLIDNIETHKFLVDFTSWYACARNNILIGDFVSLIQYDVVISSDFATKSAEMMHREPEGILGYIPEEMTNRNFIRDNMGYAPLREACLAVYGFDIKPLLKMNLKRSDDKQWPATNNVAMHRNTLKDFVRWFTPLAMHMGNHKPVGHAFERAIKLYSILSGRKNQYAPGLLSHFQMNSHKTQNFKKDQDYLHDLLARNAEPPTKP